MPDSETNSPWLCHVCDKKFHQAESQACSVCYKIACSQHMRIHSQLNRDSGLYELRPICVACQLEAAL